MNDKIKKIANQSLQGKAIRHDDALYLMQIDGDEIYDLFYWANQIRLKYFGHTINGCSIVSARQGKCTEDCRFCSQSAYYNTGIEEFNLVDTGSYSINGDNDFDKICQSIKAIVSKTCIHPHGSFGELTREMAESLVKSGLKRINHNIETSERFFPKVCSTHTFADRLNTIRIAKEAGLEICSGAIFGIGEGIEDRIDVAFTLKKLDVDVVPLNFLHPIQGTPLDQNHSIKAMDALKIISVYRFVLPDREIKIAGGRERNLRDLQSWMF